LPGEEELPGDAPTGPAVAAAVVPDPAIVAAIESMGFSTNAGKRAVRGLLIKALFVEATCLCADLLSRCLPALFQAIAVGNSDPGAATDWVLSHMEDADLNDPLPAPAGAATAAPAAVGARVLRFIFVRV
jgi:hypothetical protein